jgi:hypothetical protein
MAGDTREMERDIRTDDSLAELGASQPTATGDLPGLMGEGVYGAEGDPWVYKMDGDRVMVLNTESPGDWLPAPSAAMAAIRAQIASGDLKEGAGASAPPLGDSPPDTVGAFQEQAREGFPEVLRGEKTALTSPADPFLGMEIKSNDPYMDMKAKRNAAIDKAMGS